MKKKKIVAIVQASVTSVRFPSKVLKKIKKFTIIELLLKRLKKSKRVHKIIVAVPKSKENKKFSNFLSLLGYTIFEGSEKNVLDRYYKAAKKYKAEIVVRITGDCPLVDSSLVDDLVSNFLKNDFDYLSNNMPATLPDGLDVEIFSFKALHKTWKLATTSFDREHVTPFIIRNSGIFKKSNVKNDKDFSGINWSINEPRDYETLKKIFYHFYPNIYFGWKKIIKARKFKPSLYSLDHKKKRDEGARLNSGQKLWQRAKRSIVGGNMLLSKREDRFLPNQWPNYFSKAKDCFVWDLDNRKLIDMSIMGAGTNILGYGNNEVDEAVKKTINKGNLSTLNCPEEVYLAEKLINLHPWSSMAKFTRTGGEANAVAIRIARAASGKDKVAICGYHGWHDWYVAANLKNKNKLNKHLLAGINPTGVPKSLKNSIFTFDYNNFSQLEKIIKENPDLGIIKMEVCRNEKPANNFLQKIQEISNKKKIILIFDECTSGFRENFGGLHKKFKIQPDLAIFGKALGNGYAISAVIGKENIMKHANNTFISSTFWTERIGPTAAIKTLEIMHKIKAWEIISRTGKKIKKEWQKLADKYNLKIKISGLDPLCNFKILSRYSIEYKTLITQEMLIRGFLASDAVYVCTKHNEKIIKNYLSNLDDIFKTIKECEDGRDIKDLLKGPTSITGFGRLN